MNNRIMNAIIDEVDSVGGGNGLIKLKDGAGRYFIDNSYINIQYMRGYICSVSECKVDNDAIVDEKPVYKISLKELSDMVEYPLVTEVISDEALENEEEDVDITSATSIEAAAEDDTAVKDALDKLSDDFDYLVSSIEKLERDGVTRADILQIISNFNNNIQSAIDECINSI